MKANTTTKPIPVTRTLIVLAVLVLAELMPYLSRVPLSFAHGTPWIWEYMRTMDDVLRWNLGQLATLIPLGIFGLIFIFGNTKIPFIASTIGHFAVTCLLYHSHGDPPHNDDFLGCLVYPFMIVIPSGFAGAVALVGVTAYDAIKRRKAKQTIE